MAKKNKKQVVELPLSEEQKAFKQEINDLHDAMDEARNEYYDRKSSCTHSIGYVVRQEPWGMEGSTYCTICDLHFGHYCPESLDHACHYYTEDNGRVKLATGELVDAPDGHNSKYETDDSCIFCGVPDERK